MKNILFIKAMLVGLMLLFLFGVGVFNSGAKTASNIYVDDDNIVGPWDGTIEHPYQYIQDGIDSADPGDTIWVANGTYIENLVIEEKCALKTYGNDIFGSGIGVIIDGDYLGDVIKILADEVTIEGAEDGVRFEIKNAGILNNGINIYASYVEISWCNLDNNYVGILSRSSLSNYNAIRYCNITNCGFNAIIFMDLSNHNKIEHCTIMDNPWGLWILEAGENQILYNNIKQHEQAGITLQAPNTLRNRVQGNTISKNGIGIYLYSGARINDIVTNNFINNTRDVLFVYCVRNILRGNYWDDWKNNAPLPRPIRGYTGIPPWPIPWRNFDWSPSKDLYPIPDTP